MENLPDDVLATEIFDRLQTTESVLNSKSVSKKWRSMLSRKKVGLLLSVTSSSSWDGSLMKLFYKENLLEDNDDIETCMKQWGPENMNYTPHPIVGSCNGLVCFSELHKGYYRDIHDPTYIVNPETGEYISLPQMMDPVNASWDGVHGGFGYCERTGKYKVLRIGNHGNVEVITLGDHGKWRKINTETAYYVKGSGKFAHGYLWFIREQWSSGRELLSFDLETEKFQTHKVPPFKVPGGDPWEEFANPGLMLFGINTLCFYYLHHHFLNRMDLWTPIFNEDAPGMISDWKHESTIESEIPIEWYPIFYPVVCGKNKVLLWRQGKLSCYNMLDGTFKEIWETRVDGRHISVDIIPHMPSSVSLEKLGGQFGGFKLCC